MKLMLDKKNYPSKYGSDVNEQAWAGCTYTNVRVET